MSDVTSISSLCRYLLHVHTIIGTPTVLYNHIVSQLNGLLTRCPQLSPDLYNEGLSRKVNTTNLNKFSNVPESLTRYMNRIWVRLSTIFVIYFLALKIILDPLWWKYLLLFFLRLRNSYSFLLILMKKVYVYAPLHYLLLILPFVKTLAPCFFMMELKILWKTKNFCTSVGW